MAVDLNNVKCVREWIPLFRKMGRIGERLLAKRKIIESQLQEALHVQEENKAHGFKESVGKILIEAGSIREGDILAVFAEDLGIPYLPRLSLKTMEENGIEITREVYEILFKLCSLDVLEKEEFLFYKSEIVENGSGREWNVYCFSHDPTSYNKIIERFKQVLLQYRTTPDLQKLLPLSGVTKMNHHIVLASRGDILKTIEELKEFRYLDANKNVNTRDVYSSGRLFSEIVNWGIRAKASDIHISPNNFNGGLVIRYRKDGDLAAEPYFGYGSEKFPLSDYEEFANLVCNEAQMQSHAKNTIAQDGSIQYYADDGVSYDLRVASVPIMVGQRVISAKITIRILYKGGTRNIDSIGMLPHQLDLVKKLYAKSEGLTLLVGPTSSGKTTTIYSILNCLDLTHQSCYTIENPVEYELANASQIQVNEKAGLGFADILRNMLRQDPDIVFVGEMRDMESVESVMHIANTGHTVLSTLHANSAYNAPQRLMNMGVSLHQIAASLNLVISQRLVHKNCPQCLVEYKPSDFEISLLGLDPNETYKHGAGVVNGATCPRCAGKGYVGRIGIFEIAPTGMFPEWERHAETSETIREYFNSMKDENGDALYPDLMGDARQKMKLGLISPKSLAAVFSRLEVD